MNYKKIINRIKFKIFIFLIFIKELWLQMKHFVLKIITKHTIQ